MKSICKIIGVSVFSVVIFTKSYAQFKDALAISVKENTTTYTGDNQKRYKLDSTTKNFSEKNIYIKNTSNKNIEADALDKLAENSFKSGKIVESEVYNNKLLSVLLNVKDSILIINAKNREGLYLIERGKGKEAEIKFNEALLLSKNFKDKTAEINSNLGTVNLARGDKEKAMQYFFKALDLYEKTNNLLGIGETNSNISSVFYLSGKIVMPLLIKRKV
jgi:two-component system, NarL family, sensor histidine kinase UhpB